MLTVMKPDTPPCTPIKPVTVPVSLVGIVETPTQRA